MKITKVELEDFRQFYGHQSIAFAQDVNKNVTLVHAENGFGKTTLLNAILWCLFEQTTTKFEQPKQIVNFDAADEGTIKASVSVEFSFREKQFLAERIFRDKNKKTEFICSELRAGALTSLPNPELFIASVIPPEMAKYFFFDGEAAESFASAKNYKVIGPAIRNILGCSLAETALGDLKKIHKDLSKEVETATEDAELKEIERELIETAENLELHEGQKLEKKEQLGTYEDTFEKINQQLRESEGARQYQLKLDEINRELTRVQEDVSRVRGQIADWVGTRAVRLLGNRLSQITLDFIDENELKGKIPSPYNEDFVKQLIGSAVCICGRPLEPESEEWRKVVHLLRDAGNAELMGRINRARARSNQFTESAAETSAALIDLQSQLATRRQRLAELEKQSAEVSAKISGLPMTEIQERERAKGELKKNIAECNQALGKIDTFIDSCIRRQQELEKNEEKLKRKDVKTQKLRGKRDFVRRAKDLLEFLLKQYEVEARNQIETEVNNILATATHKDYECRFNDDFSLELLLTERSMPKSTGENQLLSLIFIASLVKFAESRTEADELLLKPGTVAPLVLDAPFGQLDESYQRETASSLPNLAEQVVVLLSSSQASNVVLDALKPKIGAEYVIISENKALKGNKEEVILRINETDYTCTLYGRKHNISTIERVA